MSHNWRGVGSKIGALCAEGVVTLSVVLKNTEVTRTDPWAEVLWHIPFRHFFYREQAYQELMKILSLLVEERDRVQQPQTGGVKIISSIIVYVKTLLDSFSKGHWLQVFEHKDVPLGSSRRDLTFTFLSFSTISLVGQWHYIFNKWHNITIINIFPLLSSNIKKNYGPTIRFTILISVYLWPSGNDIRCIYWPN